MQAYCQMTELKEFSKKYNVFYQRGSSPGLGSAVPHKQGAHFLRDLGEETVTEPWDRPH